MQPLVIGGSITAGGTYEPELLRPRSRYHADTSADPVTIAPASNRVYEQPVIPGPTPIDEDQRRAVVAVNGDIYQSIVVEITERSAACRQWKLKRRAALPGKILEFPLPVFHEQ